MPAVEDKSPVDEKQAHRACSALLAYIASNPSHSQSSNDLLADPSSDPLFAVIALHKIPEKTGNVKPFKLSLPHPFVKEDLEVCLITKDPQREYKDLLDKRGARDLVDKVIGVSKLRAKFKPYEAKRLLLKSYDLFLADDRVLPVLPSLLGKKFFEKKKQPVPIDLSKGDLRAEVESARRASYLFVAKGSSSTYKFASTSQPASQATANLLSTLSQAIKKIGGWSNVQSIHVKTEQSVAVPVYHSLGLDKASAVVEEKEEKKKEEKKLEVKGKKAEKRKAPEEPEEDEDSVEEEQDSEDDSEQEQEQQPKPKAKAKQQQQPQQATKAARKVAPAAAAAGETPRKKQRIHEAAGAASKKK